MEVPVEKVVERFVEVSFHACANTHRRTHTHTHTRCVCTMRDDAIMRVASSIAALLTGAYVAGACRKGCHG